MRSGRKAVVPASLLALALVMSGCASPPPTVVERGAMQPPRAEPAPELTESLRPPPEETLQQEMSRWEALDREWQARRRAEAANGAPGPPAEEPLAPPAQMTLAPSTSGAAGISSLDATAARPACPLGSLAHAAPETVEGTLGAVGRPLSGGDSGDWREYGLPDGSRVSVGYYGGRALAFNVQLPPDRGTPNPEHCVYAAFGISTGPLTRTGSSRDRQTWSGRLNGLPLRDLRAIRQGSRYSLAQVALDFPDGTGAPPAAGTPPLGTSGSTNPGGATAVQCLGVTKEGRRCRRTTTNPSGLCYQHGG